MLDTIEMDDFSFVFDYELGNSFIAICFAWIPSDYLQDKITDYLIWKTRRKLKMYRALRREMADFRIKVAK